jgi:hypothetical protein
MPIKPATWQSYSQEADMEVALILTSLAGLGLAFSLAWLQERRRQQAFARCRCGRHLGPYRTRPR